MNNIWSKATNLARGGGADGGTTTTAADADTSTRTNNISSSSSSSWTYWDYATSSMSNAAEATYSLFPNVPSSWLWPLFGGTTLATTTTVESSSSPTATTITKPSSLLGLWAYRLVEKKADAADSISNRRSSMSSFRRLIGSGSSSNSTYNNNMSWMMNNPYNSIRGRHGGYQQSMYAVRTFLTVAPVEESTDTAREQDENDETLAAVSHALMSDALLDTSNRTNSGGDGGGSGDSAYHRVSSTGSLAHLSSKSRSSQQNSLTACHVAEGTIRALRDLLLNEAVELNAALRFWSDRWERPLLSFLEAGPIGTFFILQQDMMMTCS
jgi:hypothetical protein